MKKHLYILCILLLSTSAFAQVPCDGKRYLTSIFTSIKSEMNVQFGQNKTLSGATKNLYMDIYQPMTDTARKHPLYIFLFGGGFVSGDRTQGTGFCNYHAAQGFVAATIDYRLIDAFFTDSTTMIKAILMAIGDAKAAVRYFVEDAAGANKYKVDTNYIFLAGLSAGAITSMHTAYLNTNDNVPAHIRTIINDIGGFKGNSSTNTRHTTPIRGVLNYSGAMLYPHWLSKNEAALLSVHNLGDTVVPCANGKSSLSSFGVGASGSCRLKTQADAVGVRNDVLFFPDNTHGGYITSGDTAMFGKMVRATNHFLYTMICTSGSTSLPAIEKSSSIFTIFPNPAQNTLSIQSNYQGAFELRLTNTTGQCVLSQSLSGESNSLDISGLTKGLYYCEVKRSTYSQRGKLVIE